MNEFMLENVSLRPELPLIPFTVPVPEAWRPPDTDEKWLIILPDKVTCHLIFHISPTVEDSSFFSFKALFSSHLYEYPKCHPLRPREDGLLYPACRIFLPCRKKILERLWRFYCFKLGLAKLLKALNPFRGVCLRRSIQIGACIEAADKDQLVLIVLAAFGGWLPSDHQLMPPKYSSHPGVSCFPSVPSPASHDPWVKCLSLALALAPARLWVAFFLTATFFSHSLGKLVLFSDCHDKWSNLTFPTESARDFILIYFASWWPRR